jgi:dTMP kinase
MKGLFVTFEGGEGGGKTTQVQRLCKRLRDLGRNPLPLNDPGCTKLGMSIREIVKRTPSGDPISPKAELFLFEAARAQLVDTVIAPSLSRGMDIVCDRYIDSTVAYQGFGRGINMVSINRMNQFATESGGFSIYPDITFWLDIDPELGLQRTASKRMGQGKVMDRLENETLAFHNRVRHGYWTLSQMNGSVLFRLDATKGEDELEEEIWLKVFPRLPAPAVETSIDVSEPERKLD